MGMYVMSQTYGVILGKIADTNLWNFLDTDQAGPVTDKSVNLLVKITPDRCKIILFFIKPDVIPKLFNKSHLKDYADVRCNTTSPNPPKTEGHSRVSETEKPIQVRTLLMPLPMLTESVWRQTEANDKPSPFAGLKLYQSRRRSANTAALRLQARWESTAHRSVGNAGSCSSLRYGASIC